MTEYLPLKELSETKPNVFKHGSRICAMPVLRKIWTLNRIPVLFISGRPEIILILTLDDGSKQFKISASLVSNSLCFIISRIAAALL